MAEAANALKPSHPRPSMTQRPSSPEPLALWSSVDRYYEELLIPPDAALAATLRASAAAGLPEIQVSPLQGRFLQLLAQALGARRILEIGTLGGYSTLWLARALPPDGRVVTLEIDPRHAEVALSNLKRAGVVDRVDLRLGPALTTLPTLVAERAGPFDLVFIDADKTAYPDYLDWSVRLARSGSLIVADNVVRRGDVADPDNSDPQVEGIRRMNERIRANPRLRATVIQTVGVKGHDGFAVVRVEAKA